MRSGPFAPFVVCMWVHTIQEQWEPRWDSLEFSSQRCLSLGSTAQPSRYPAPRHLRHIVEGLHFTQGRRSHVSNRTGPGGVSQIPNIVTTQILAFPRARASSIV